MPIHDWTRVNAGLFHDFHQVWSVELRNALNRAILPQGFTALVEQRVRGPEPDVIAIETSSGEPGGNVGLLEAPQTKMVMQARNLAERYAQRANRIAIHHELGQVVAVIEIVSPGNKSSKSALQTFKEKAIQLLRSGIHLLIVDLFPPSKRDPQGIHEVIFSEFVDDEFVLPAGKRLTLVGYQADENITAYIEPVGVGDSLPDMPLFITPKSHVLVPLDATYQATWDACPAAIRKLVESE
jgi:hypothetical protein